MGDSARRMNSLLAPWTGLNEYMKWLSCRESSTQCKRDCRHSTEQRNNTFEQGSIETSVFYQEDGQLKLIIQDDSMDTTGPAESSCDLSKEVCMEDKKQGARSWDRKHNNGTLIQKIKQLKLRTEERVFHLLCVEGVCSWIRVKNQVPRTICGKPKGI